MKCTTAKCRGKAQLIMTKKGKVFYCCSDCWIDLNGLRADFNHYKKNKKSPPN